MISLIRFVVSVASIAAILSGCSYTFDEDPVDSEPAVNTAAVESEDDTETAEQEASSEETESSVEASENKTIQVGTVKPEIDYSSEQPDCEVAAERIRDNIQVGMTLADVKRLVGKPRVVIPGTWTWTKGLSFGEKPQVKFGFSSSGSDAVITSFSANPGAC